MSLSVLWQNGAGMSLGLHLPFCGRFDGRLVGGSLDVVNDVNSTKCLRVVLTPESSCKGRSATDIPPGAGSVKVGKGKGSDRCILCGFDAGVERGVPITSCGGRRGKNEAKKECGLRDFVISNPRRLVDTKDKP